jgi:Rrf2 family protein
VRGAQGGYLLARSPEQITLREVFDVLEGPDAFVPCTDHDQDCPRSATCLTRDIWAEMYAAAMGVLESYTLAALAARHRQDAAQYELMYEI